MRAVLSGGGTAGHINPAIATAEVLRDRGFDVQFAGRPVGNEREWVTAADIPFKPFEAEGFHRGHPTTLVKGLAIDAKSTKLAKQWFSEIQPDVVVGFGGYVSIPVGRAAVQMGIPLVIHEQNSVMGWTNRYLAGKAKAVCLTYEHARADMKDGSKAVLTGCPVRASVFSTTREAGREALGIPADARLLLVTGGSNGARHLNQAVCACKDDVLAREDLHVIHVTGPKELDSVAEALALTPAEQERWHLFGYTNQMPACMAACDAIVSRAGASSLAEISARAIPALLVPFPFATADHQTTNAKAYVEAGCAHMLADDQVETPEFARLLAELVDDADLRASMTAAARAQNTANAAQAVADVVMAAMA